jgi:hypothetical protein
MSAFTQLLKVLSTGKNPLAGFGAQTRGKILPYSEETILSNVRKNAPEILSEGRKYGFSFDPRRGKFTEAGEQAGSFMSSIPNDPTLPVKAGGGVATNVDELLNVVRKPEMMSRLQRNEYLGGYNPEGTLGLDPSKRFITDYNALRSGLKTDQAEGFRSLRFENYPVTESQKDIARNTLLKNTSLATALGSGAVAGADYLPDQELGDVGKAALFPLLVGGTAYTALRNPVSLKGASNIDFLSGALAGTADKSAGLISKQAKKLILPTEKEIITPESIKQGTVNYSKLGQDANKKMQSQIKTVKDDNNKEVESLVYKSMKEYPEEFKNLGFVPIKGYDYIKGAGNKKILNLDEEETISFLSENIKNAVKLSNIENDSQFYVKYNKFINDNADVLSPEELASYGSQFSAGASPESELKAFASFLRKPTVLPKEGATRSTGVATAKAIRAQQFKNPMDKFAIDLDGRLIKIGNYANNKLNPTDPNFITVDTHAANLALGTLVKKGKSFSLPNLQDKDVYQLFMKAYKKAADDLGMLPSEVQSASWYGWRSTYYNPTRTLDQVLAQNPLTNINPIFKKYKAGKNRFENIMDVKREQIVGVDYQTQKQKDNFLDLALRNPPKKSLK